MQKRGFAGWNGKKLSIAVGGGDHHLAGLDLADELGADDVERAGLRGEHPAVADPAEHQRAHAERVADADELGAGHRDDGEGALDAAQRVLQPLGDGLLDRARHQVDDALGVRARLEDRAVLRSAPRAAQSALVRLPLWAMAQPPMANSAKSGCTSRIWVAPLEPAVE